MKKTKKILSLILVVLMLVSAVLTIANATDYKVDNIIYFGSYPQSEVKDEATINALNELAPEWGEWISYSYYSGEGKRDTMQSGNWMRYIDLEYNGQKYRGVQFEKLRPYKTYDIDESYQDDNGYNANVAYWFAFETMKWRILEPNKGLIMSELIIDAQPFNNNLFFRPMSPMHYQYFSDALYTNYACDYETSSIRGWLTNNFYNTVFTDVQKSAIKPSVLNNDGYHTILELNENFKYDSNPTNDKVFLLSGYDVLNSEYFGETSKDKQDALRIFGTDYAKSQGLEVSTAIGIANGNSSWILRSPGNSSVGCCITSALGEAIYTQDTNKCIGIRPAMYVDLDKVSNNNIYNLGEETYSFNNYGDSDSRGHCFGMSMTSSGYHLGLLDPSNVGATSSQEVYGLSDTLTVRVPICNYQAIQGSYRDYSMVAGGSYYKNGIYNIYSDWEEVINYVKNHNYDNTGTLQIGYRKSGRGGHAINFLRYEVVDGQERIYAYDNNFPDIETYFYKDSNGSILQAPEQTFSGSIDCITLRDVNKYFSIIEKVDRILELIKRLSVYAEKDMISIEVATAYPMEGAFSSAEYYMYELPEDTTTVKIKPLVENATFTYMEQEYRFSEINEDTYAEFTLSTSEEDTPEFKIINAPEDEPENKPCSCNCHKGGISGFFFKIINFFEKLFGKNKVCACGVKH